MILQAHGQRIDLTWDDPQDHIPATIIRKKSFYERGMLEDIYTRVPRGGTAVDVGAHIGNHTLWLAKVCGYSVVAFEPHPVTRARLEANLRANSAATKVRLIRGGAGPYRSTGTVYSPSAGNSGMNQLRQGSGDVDIIPIDALGLKDVRLIKIDVEGSELGVLHGAVETITRHHPFIYVEAATEESHRQVTEFLEQLGYQEFGCFNATPTYGFGFSTVKVSAAIMAHPSRRPFVEQLQHRVPEAQVVWDRINDRWDTGARALQAFDPSATHHLVIQDDALVCNDLVEGARRALTIRSHTPVSFYLGAQRPHGQKFARFVTQAKLTKASWVAHKELCWGVGVALPTAYIPELLEWGAHQSIENYDMRMSKWFEQNRLPTWYLLPSLVDHRRGDVNPSLVPGRTGINRVARWFAGEQTSATSLSLTTKAVGGPIECPVCRSPEACKTPSEPFRGSLSASARKTALSTR